MLLTNTPGLLDSSGNLVSELDVGRLDEMVRTGVDGAAPGERVEVKVDADALARRTGWAAHKVSSTLLFMELEGIVKQLPGMYYALTT